MREIIEMERKIRIREMKNLKKKMEMRKGDKVNRRIRNETNKIRKIKYKYEIESNKTMH